MQKAAFFETMFWINCRGEKIIQEKAADSTVCFGEGGCCGRFALDNIAAVGLNKVTTPKVKVQVVG